MLDVADLTLPSLVAEGTFSSRSAVPITDVRGDTVATLSLAPSPLVARTISALRKASPRPRQDRLAAIRTAGELFANNKVAGLTPDRYARLASGASGLSISTVRESMLYIARRCADLPEVIEAGRPTAVLPEPPGAGQRAGARWVRKGEVLGVHAPGNHPSVHVHWLEPLALGYRVVVRPSRREPFTAHRLISALRESGFSDDQVAMLATDHGAAGEILHGTDLSILYGGDDVVSRYAGSPRVLAQGPGRSKILITADTPWQDQLEMIVESISEGGGTGCVHTTAVLIEGDPRPAAEAVAARLARLPSRMPEDAAAILPVHPIESARKLEAYLRRTANDGAAEAVLGGDGIVDQLDEHCAALRPAVHVVPTPLAPQIRVELPFPCVWFAPWSRGDGVAPLRETLALSLLTEDESLIERCLAEPSIRNVYTGGLPTNFATHTMPHDGFLSAFLMDVKGYAQRSREG